MKKLIAVILAAVMLLALCACGDNASDLGSVGTNNIPEGKASLMMQYLM